MRAAPRLLDPRARGRKKERPGPLAAACRAVPRASIIACGGLAPPGAGRPSRCRPGRNGRCDPSAVPSPEGWVTTEGVGKCPGQGLQVFKFAARPREGKIGQNSFLPNFKYDAESLRTRFGTQAGEAPAGTDERYERAVAELSRSGQKRGAPLHSAWLRIAFQPLAFSPRLALQAGTWACHATPWPAARAGENQYTRLGRPHGIARHRQASPAPPLSTTRSNQTLLS